MSTNGTDGANGLVATRRRTGEVPQRVETCLRALGVKFNTGVSFWLENEGELEWLLKDAYQQWRERIKVAHTDYGGTHEEAVYWNTVWQRAKKLFGDHRIFLAEAPRPVERNPRVQPLKPKKTTHKSRVLADVAAMDTFTMADVKVDLGKRRNVHCAVFQLVKANKLERIRRGIYRRMISSVVPALLLLTSVTGWCDGPDTNQHFWRSNGMIYASADIPACHVARWERRVEPNTNWLSAVTVEEEPFTRNVVFSESLSLFPGAWFRVHILRVPWCPTVSVRVGIDGGQNSLPRQLNIHGELMRQVMTTMSPCATLWPIKL